MATESNSTPSGKTSTLFDIESLMTPNTSLLLNNHMETYGISPSFSPSFSPYLGPESPFFNKDYKLSERGYLEATNSVPRALFPLQNLHDKSTTQQPSIYAKKSAPPHDSDGETLRAISNIPGLKTTNQQDLLDVASQVPNPLQTGHSEENRKSPEPQKEKAIKAIKKNVVRRTSKPEARCPGGCQLFFLIGSNQFTSHLIEYHKIESDKTRKILRALHKKEAEQDLLPNGKPARSELPSCSICYNKCQTYEDAKACAASHDVDENSPLRCVHGCLQNKKPLIFKSKQTLQKHMREQHGQSTKTATSKMTHTCHACSKTFSSGSNLKRHLKDVHKEVAHLPSTVSSSSLANLKQNNKDVQKGVPTVPLFDPVTTISLNILPVSTAPLTTDPSTNATMSTSTFTLSNPTTSGTEMPGASGVSQNLVIQTASVDETVSLSQRSWSSNEGLILSQ